MRSRTTVYYFIFSVPAILLIFLPIIVCYDESPWQPVVYDYYQIDLSGLGVDPGENLHSRIDYHHGGTNHKTRHKVKGQSDRDVVVDITNSLGLKLLAIHNEHNEYNIALSPYGAFSVLAVLLEGLQGEAVHEILHSTHIPKDRHVIRVGLRDIHRHLKSYFIPEEGFLAGLTLNLNNVTLRSEYEEVLHFYGFDYGSLNNALYPDPPTTKKSIEITTLETGLSISEDSTVLPEDKTTICTTTASTSDTEIFKINESTTAEMTIQAKDERTTAPSSEKPPTTQKFRETTAVSTSLIPSIPSATILKLELTTTEMPKEISSTEWQTTMEEPLAVSKTSSSFTTPKVENTTTISTSNILTETPTTTATPEATNFVKSASTTEEIITKSPVSPLKTSTLPQESITVPPHITTITQKVIATQPTTIVKPTAPHNIETTTQDTTISLGLDATLTTVVQETTVVTEALVTNSSNIQTGSLEGVAANTAVPEVFSNTNPQGAESTTANFFFGTTPEFQDMTPTNPNFDFQNYQYDNVNTPIYDDVNVVNQIDVQNNPAGGGVTPNNNFKRNARSVVDYVIARFYDDHPHYQPRQPPHFAVEDSPTFATYGRYRESGVVFMKYDTVLPYFYVKNLNAWALSFPLDSSKYYLLLLLPIRDDGVDQLICDLRLHGDIRYIIENLRLTHVVATIPSFTLKGYVTLTPALQTLGIRKIFEPRQADFGPMTNVTDIFVTNIEQAVTVTIRNYLDPSAQNYKNFEQYPPVLFKADHPFLYFVMDSELNVALMMGKVVNPLNFRIR